MKYKQTPSQTIGPFFAYGLTAEQYNYKFNSIAHPEIAGPAAIGQPIMITGQVFDGGGTTVSDAMLEFWQADAQGKYKKSQQNPRDKGFKGFGRIGTGANAQHKYTVHSIKPGAIGGHAPFIHVVLFMRGMLNHQFTRIYFSDEESANEKDPVLNLVPVSRRTTLIARRMNTDGVMKYRFDIHMQGNLETVFFDL